MKGALRCERPSLQADVVGSGSVKAMASLKSTDQAAVREEVQHKLESSAEQPAVRRRKGQRSLHAGGSLDQPAETTEEKMPSGGTSCEPQAKTYKPCGPNHACIPAQNKTLVSAGKLTLIGAIPVIAGGLTLPLHHRCPGNLLE